MLDTKRWDMDKPIEMKGITRCKLTIISESAICKKFLGQIQSYAASLQISNSHSLECYVVIFCFYHRFERIFLSFLWFILMNTQLQKNSFKSMSCLHRIQQFPRNFLSWQAPGCISLYSFKSMDKPQLTGQNSGRVFYSRNGYMCAMHWCGNGAKQPNLKLKTRSKQLLGSPPLDSGQQNDI